MWFSAIGALFVGGGLGYPLTTLIKNYFFKPENSIKRNSDAVVEVNWMGKGINEEINMIFNGLGEMIHSEGRSDGKEIEGINKKKGEVLGIKLTSWSTFKNNICEELGLSDGQQKGGIVCHRNIK